MSSHAIPKHLWRLQNWDVALDDLTKLKEMVDSNTFAPVLEQLQQRTWLMHWALFIFFNHENGRNLIIDFFFQDRCDTAVPRLNVRLARCPTAAMS